MRRLRLPLCLSILDAARDMPKFKKWLEQHKGGREEFALDHFRVLVDCLARSYTTGDPAYGELYQGEILKLAHEPVLEPKAQHDLRQQVSEAVLTAIARWCKPHIDSDALDRLVADLEHYHRVINTPVSRTVDVLLLGDCYYLEIVSFLAGPLREEGIELNPTFLTSRSQADLRASLSEHAGKNWAAVFYSPFTYTFADFYSQSLSIGCGMAPAQVRREMVEPAMETIRRNLDLLAAQFDCPIFVHNSANIRRHNSTLADRLKIAWTRATRTQTRLTANKMLEDHAEKINRSTFKHIHIFKESLCLDEFGEWQLGRRFYDSTLHHHTILSREVAFRYRELLIALVQLSTRKLVVCDLDNTLWEGEIGEGAVSQYHDRQAVLKRLRQKGVLLAINSRNDRRNVHFRGALLDESDFVASEINWDPKTTNIARIQKKLNLKTKDFVFIDDRADQRELVSAAYPEVRVLDATAPCSWRILEIWSQLIAANDEGDRTRMYREREERDLFLTNQVEAVDQVSLMAKLRLQARIRVATRADLKRVVELVNRTNQFNLTGARTSFHSASEWHAARDHRILVIDGSDQFGSMGIICVAFVEWSDTTIHVSTFVLSCRVFGYGFETVMLETIQDLAARDRPADKPRTIIGQFSPTDLNQPCRSMYPNHGFVRGNDSYLLEGGPPLQSPPWLEINRQSLLAAEMLTR